VADSKQLRDLFVTLAARHKLENLHFARAERHEVLSGVLHVGAGHCLHARIQPLPQLSAREGSSSHHVVAAHDRPDYLHQLLRLNVLRAIGRASRAHGVQHLFHVVIGCQQHHRGGDLFRLQPAGNLQAIDARQIDVQQQHVGMQIVHQLQGFFAR